MVPYPFGLHLAELPAVDGSSSSGALLLLQHFTNIIPQSRTEAPECFHARLDIITSALLGDQTIYFRARRDLLLQRLQLHVMIRPCHASAAGL